MKLSINIESLVLALNTVCKAISNRTTLPILENIFMQIESDYIIFRGNDLELGIEYKLPIKSEETINSTNILIKANTFNEIITKLNSESVDLTLDEQYKINIKANNIDFDIYGISTEQYPQFPDIEKDIQFELKPEILLTLIRHTIFSVSHDETKQFLNGIKIVSKGKQCDFISTDGFRLSMKYAEFDEELPEFSCIVPYKTMNELYKILNGLKSDKLKIYLSEKQISFEINGCKIVSRLINGRFPDYKQVLTKESLFEFKLTRNLLQDALDRANIIASKCNYVAKFDLKENSVKISANSPKLGDYSEEVQIKRYVGEKDIIISFNIKLLQEALKIIEQSEITIEMNSELSPCIIKPIGDSTYIHVLMPIRMSENTEESLKKEDIPAIQPA